MAFRARTIRVTNMKSIDVALIFLFAVWGILGVHHVMEDDDELPVSRLQSFIFLLWGGPFVWVVFVILSLMLGWRNLERRLNEWRG